MAPKKLSKAPAKGKAPSAIAMAATAATGGQRSIRSARTQTQTQTSTDKETQGQAGETIAKSNQPQKRGGGSRAVGKTPATKMRLFNQKEFEGIVGKFVAAVGQGDLETISVNPILEALLNGSSEIFVSRPDLDILETNIDHLQSILDVINDAMISRTSVPNVENFNEAYIEILRKHIGSLETLRTRYTASTVDLDPQDWCKIHGIGPHMLAGDSRVAPYSGEVWWADRPPYFLDGENPYFIEVASNRIKQDLFRGAEEKRAAANKNAWIRTGKVKESGIRDIEPDKFWALQAEDWKLAIASTTVMQFAGQFYSDAMKSASEFRRMRLQQKLHEAEKQRQLENIPQQRRKQEEVTADEMRPQKRRAPARS